MKFQRTDLIARVEAETARRTKAAADRTAKAAQEHEKRRAKHIDRTGEAWIEFATTIRRRVRAAQPIAAADIPKVLRDGYSGGHVLTFDDKAAPEYTADTRNLETLLDLLTSATDDVISTSSLEAMGFRMHQLFAR